MDEQWAKAFAGYRKPVALAHLRGGRSFFGIFFGLTDAPDSTRRNYGASPAILPCISDADRKTSCIHRVGEAFSVQVLALDLLNLPLFLTLEPAGGGEGAGFPQRA